MTKPSQAVSKLNRLTKSTFKTSETTTESIFRSFYGSKTFIEKSAISKSCGFKSKNKTLSDGYPDFYKDIGDFAIVVEAKALKQKDAEKEVLFYLQENKINKDLIGIALSGQSESELRVTYFFKEYGTAEKPRKLNIGDILLPLDAITKAYKKNKYGETVTEDELKLILKNLNSVFHKGNKVRDTDRSLLFAGLMIALTDDNFRATYKNIKAPSRTEKSTVKAAVLEAHNLNKAILESISSQLTNKINNLSKEFSWRDKFSFVKTIDYTLEKYKWILETIEEKILVPFQNEEKQDILGRAYKIFLSRAGKIDSKNIILTPDHIKGLMVKLARLHKDDVVLDTCTGSGGFLMEAMETMIRLAGDDHEKAEQIKEEQLIGFEIDPVLFALACSNMFLHGDGRTNLLYRSSLLSGRNQDGIITGSDNDLLGYIQSLEPTKCIINPPYEKNSSILFVKQALEYLEPNGKLVIIMPKPTLSHNAAGLTKDILKIAKLDYVIKMPTRLFAEQKRTVNTAIFGFTKTPHRNNDDVLFYDLEDDGHVSIQHKGRVDKENRWSSIEHTVLDAIANGREIQDVCEKRKIYLGNVLNCAGVKSKRSGNYQMVAISELFEVKKGSLASEEAKDGDYDFITASEDWKKHDSYNHDCGAIVYAVAASGSLGRSHYVNGKFIASNLCLVLTPKEESAYKVDLRFYNCYFESIRKRIVSDLADGTSKLTISKEDFENYYVDYVPLTEQEKFVKRDLGKIEAMKKALATETKKIESNMQKLF